MKRTLFKILLSTQLVLVLTTAANPARALEIEAITKPSADIMLSFVRGGRVAEVSVKEGDLVEEGQILTKQEDQVELLQLQQMEAQAKNTARIESVRVELVQKEQDFEKLKWAQSQGAVTNWELDHAELDLRTAKISLRQARLELKQVKLRRDELKAQLRLLSIFSPINGQVEKIQIEPGESPQPLTPVIRVVKIDPLLIDVHVPYSQAQELAGQQMVSVVGPDRELGEKPLGRATIKYIAAVADAASNTLRLQLELPNPERQPAGKRVLVRFDSE